MGEVRVDKSLTAPEATPTSTDERGRTRRQLALLLPRRARLNRCEFFGLGSKSVLSQRPVLSVLIFEGVKPPERFWVRQRQMSDADRARSSDSRGR